MEMLSGERPWWESVQHVGILKARRPGDDPHEWGVEQRPGVRGRRKAR